MTLPITEQVARVLMGPSLCIFLGTKSDLASDPDNWKDRVVPMDGDSIDVMAEMCLDLTISLNEITVRAACPLKFPAKHSVEISGDVTTPGTIQVEGEVSFGSGTVTIQKELNLSFGASLKGETPELSVQA